METTVKQLAKVQMELAKTYLELLLADDDVKAQKLEELRQTFRDFVRDQYPGVSFKDIIKLTASHYFGIVPLHQNQEHRRAYLQTAAALLSSIPKGM